MAAGIAVPIWVMSVTVMGLTACFQWMVPVMGAFSLWVAFLVLLLIRKRGEHFMVTLILPIFFLGILFLFNGIAFELLFDGEVEEARARGDALMVRLVAYQESQGIYPPNLQALQDWDGQPLPESGLGWFGPQAIRYSSWDNGADCQVILNDTGGYSHFRSPDGDWWGDD